MLGHGVPHSHGVDLRQLLRVRKVVHPIGIHIDTLLLLVHDGRRCHSQQSRRELLKVAHATQEGVELALYAQTKHRIVHGGLGVTAIQWEQSIDRVEVRFIFRIGHSVDSTGRNIVSKDSTRAISGNVSRDKSLAHLQSTSITARRHVLGQMLHTTKHAFMVVTCDKEKQGNGMRKECFTRQQGPPPVHFNLQLRSVPLVRCLNPWLFNCRKKEE